MKIYKHVCEICGDTFESTSNRAKYCKYCRDKAQVLYNKAYAKRKAAGQATTVGSEQICPICGKTFTVASGSQKYCKDCRAKVKSKRENESGYNQRYTKENYDSTHIYVPKGQLQEIKDYAKAHNTSVNRLFITALEEYFEKHEPLKKSL